jgi:hypothetical protein
VCINRCLKKNEILQDSHSRYMTSTRILATLIVNTSLDARASRWGLTIVFIQNMMYRYWNRIKNNIKTSHDKCVTMLIKDQITLLIFGQHMLPIMEEEIIRNKIIQQKPIFDHREPPHEPHANSFLNLKILFKY